MNRSSIRYAETSVRGPVRELNEDYTVVTPVTAHDEGGDVEGLLAIVADGMGGHDAGDVASRTATEAFIAHIERALAEPRAASSPAGALREAMEAANRTVYDCSVEAGSSRGMGTTLTAVLLLNGVAWICHVGDTRAYLISGGRVRRLTTDDSLVQSKIDSGIISDQEARRSTQRNVLLQAVGTGDTIDPEIGKLDLPDDFRLLLVSDGTHGALHEADILEAMVTSESPQAACEDLIERAAVRDGSDNLSAIALWGPEKPPRTLIIPPERSTRRPAKWLFAGILAVAVALAVWIWIPTGGATTKNDEETTPPPPDLWAIADEVAEDAELLVVEVELQDGSARLRYRNPDHPLRFAIGDSGRNDLDPTGSEDDAEVVVEDIGVLKVREGESEEASWLNAPVVLMLTIGEDGGGRWRLSRSVSTGLDDRHTGIWIDGSQMHGRESSDGIEEGPLEDWPTDDIRFYAPGPKDVEIVFWMQGAPEELAEETPGDAAPRDPGARVSAPRPTPRPAPRRIPRAAPPSQPRRSAPPSSAQQPTSQDAVNASGSSEAAARPTEPADEDEESEADRSASGDDGQPPSSAGDQPDATSTGPRQARDDAESEAGDDGAANGDAQQEPAPSSKPPETDAGGSAAADQTPVSLPPDTPGGEPNGQ